MTNESRNFDDFMAQLFGQKPPMCDCPPGECVGGGTDEGMDPLTAMFMGLDHASSVEHGGLTFIVIDPMIHFPAADFEPGEVDTDDDEIDLPETFAGELADREAVHQLGRILEGLTAATELHAQLVAEIIGV